jgi:hypothetical protein
MLVVGVVHYGSLFYFRCLQLIPWWWGLSDCHSPFGSFSNVGAILVVGLSDCHSPFGSFSNVGGVDWSFCFLHVILYLESRLVALFASTCRGIRWYRARAPPLSCDDPRQMKKGRKGLVSSPSVHHVEACVRKTISVAAPSN